MKLKINLLLKQKLNILLFIIFAGLIIIFIRVSFFAKPQIENYNFYDSLIINLCNSNTNLEINTNIFLSDFNKKNEFFITDESKKLKIIQNEFKKIDTILNEIIENKITAEINLIKNILKLKKIFSKKKELFSKIKEKLKIIGNEKHGLKGEIYEIDKSFNDFENDILIEKIFFILKYEKNKFLTDRKKEHIINFNKNYEQLLYKYNSFISENKSFFNAENKQFFKNILKYKRLFISLIKEVRDLGSFKKNGLKNSFYKENLDFNKKLENFTEIYFKKREKETEKIIIKILLIVIFLIFLMVFFAYSFLNTNYHSIMKIKNYLKEINLGNYNIKKIKSKKRNEISDIILSVNKLMDLFNNIKIFVTEIGNGNFDVKYEKKAKNDIIANSLLQMKNNLKKLENNRKKDKIKDEKILWARHGLEKLINILRQNKNIKDLSNEILSAIVEYLKANQGGLYVYNDENKNDIHINLIAAYAYSRIRYKKNKILLNEGLIGSCVLEKKTIFLKKVPERYFKIASGLGKSKPKCLLIVPIKIEEKIFGVLELASFEYFKEHEIKFLENIAKNIASTLESAKINEKTKKLLKESQKKSDLMKIQEEEMKNNMDILCEIQNETMENERKFNSILNAINDSVMIMELDIDGKITDLSVKLIDFLSYEKEEVLGNYHGFLSEGNEFIENLEDFWGNLKNGKKQEVFRKIYTANGEFKVKETYTPLLNKTGKTYKILNIINF